MEQNRHIGFVVKTLSNLIKREVDRALMDVWEDEVTANHCRITAYLYRNRDRDVYQRELETHFNIRRSTVTQTLQLMEKNGVIARVSAENDARQKKLLLTQRGLEMQEKGKACIDSFETKLCADISEEELDSFLKTVEKLTANLKEMSECTGS